MVEYEYPCDDCGRGFLTKQALRGHLACCPAIDSEDDGKDGSESSSQWAGRDRTNFGRVVQAIDDCLEGDCDRNGNGSSEAVEFSSRELSQSVGLPPRAVGNHLGMLRRRENQYRIEMRGHSPRIWVIQREE